MVIILNVCKHMKEKGGQRCSRKKQFPSKSLHMYLSNHYLCCGFFFTSTL